MSTTVWKRTKVSAAVSTAVCSLAAGQPNQAAAQEVLEEIVTVGVRASLRNSMDTKRDSTGVVEAISAEDIGKFPDTNLAESMQRITGVSIDRVNGEGSEVTVRGFGPGFNLVTLNGRQLPGANIASVTATPGSNGNVGNSRSFDFSNLASEGVSAVEVYKTGSADVPTGGVGATVNIVTTRPLEGPPTASIGIKAMHDESGEDDITPELSGLWRWQNDAENFGISLFGSYQERSMGTRTVEVADYFYFDYDPAAGFLENATVENAPAPGSLIALPANLGLARSNVNRERINGMITAQYAPTDRTTITADVLYTSNELDQDALVPGIWYSRQFSFVEFDGNSTVAIPNRLVELIAPPDGRGKDYFFATYDTRSLDEMLTFGINLEHALNDNWTVMADYAVSNAESGGNHPDGRVSWRFNVAAAGAGWQVADYSGATPVATVGVVENSGPAGGNANGQLDPGDIATQTVIDTTSDMDTDIDQFKLGAAWDNEDGTRVEFGVGYIDTEMTQTNLENLDFLGGWGVGFRDIPDPSVLIQEDVTAAFDDLGVGGVTDAASIAPPGYVLTNIGSESFTFNSPKGFVESLSPYLRPDGSVYDINNPTQTGFGANVIEEEIFSAYFSASFQGEIGSFTTETNVGVRYEKTDVVSTTNQTVPVLITWTSDNDFRQNFSSGRTPVAEKYDYDNVLPNIDFSVDITDEWKARTSVSQTIARPGYGDMFVTTGVQTPGTLTALGGIAAGNKGTARLDPLESTNFDLSVEYYYGESSYASVGYYRKAVNNFVGTDIVPQSLFGLTDPTSGAPGTLSGDAIAALQAQGWSANEQNIFTMSAILANPQDFPNGAADYLDPSQPGGADLALDIIALYDIDASPNDPLFEFNVRQPVNNETANIDGWEFAVQHFFGDSGFGLQANATIVDGDIGYDVAAPVNVTQFALLGLSDSANLVGIYERGDWSARIAYNWRDAFLADANRSTGNPLFIDTYEQIDFNVSWTATDNLSFALDGINVTAEEQVAFSRTQNMVFYNSETDPRWILSARYGFQ